MFVIGEAGGKERRRGFWCCFCETDLAVEADEVRVRDAVTIATTQPLRDDVQHTCAKPAAVPWLRDAHASQYEYAEFGCDSDDADGFATGFCDPHGIAGRNSTAVSESLADRGDLLTVRGLRYADFRAHY